MKTLAMLTGLLLMAGMANASTPAPAKVEQTIKASAVVTMLDVANRRLTILTDAGDQLMVDVDPAVRNLAQVKVGDKILVTYYESIGLSLSKAGDSTRATGQVDVSRAKVGERPAGSARSTTTVPVTIVSVDTNKNVVKFYGADNLVRTTDVVRPEGKAFIKNLKAGDVVEITYTESLAVSVEPAK
jgi:hypothetical protein